MKKTLKKATALALVGFVMASLVACGGSKDTAATKAEASSEDTTSNEYPKMNLKLSHEENDGELEDIYADYFAKLMNEKSGGNINVQVYVVGTLGDSSNLFELTTTGTCEFGLSCPGAVAPIIPEVNVFSQHFFFPSDVHEMDKLIDEGAAGFTKLNEYYSAQGVTVKQWLTELGNLWTANKPITKPDDFKGVKFRTMAASAISESYKAYGADAISIPYTELYTALQLGTADGQVNPANGTYLSGFGEVQKYTMTAYPDIFMATFAVNSKWYESQPDNVKALIDECASEAYDLYKAERDKMETEWLDGLAEQTEMVEFTDEMRAPFKEISESRRDIYVNLAGDNGKELNDLFIADMNNILGK